MPQRGSVAAGTATRLPPPAAPVLGRGCPENLDGAAGMEMAGCILAIPPFVFLLAEGSPWGHDAVLFGELGRLHIVSRNPP